MIVVIEGPSVAGKTTWCRRHAPQVVGECAPDGNEPDAGDPVAQTSLWSDVDCRRGQTALDLERNRQTVVCDTDPFRLHCPWDPGPDRPR